MSSILFYLIEQQDLEAPIVKQFKTMTELFKYVQTNNLNTKNVKIISSNVYFYTPNPDEHVEIKYKYKAKKKKESGDDK